MSLSLTMQGALREFITEARCKQTLIELVKVPSPQTELLEAEPLLRVFIETAVEPRLRAMGFTDIRYDAMSNLIAEIGPKQASPSLMFISNAMNQPQATMKNAYAGDVEDGAKYGLPGEVVLGKGASEQKATMAAMLTAIEAVLKAGVALKGRLVFLCCTSGETGKHDAIRSVVETMGVRADMAVLGGTSLTLSLGNRGRIDVFINVEGSASHSSNPKGGANAITGAIEVIRNITQGVKLDGEHPKLGRPTLAVTHIRSFPDSTHTIQASCEITVDRRLLPGQDPQAALADITEQAMKVDGMADPVSGKPFKVSVRLGPFMYPSLLKPDAPVVGKLVSAIGTALQRAPEMYYSASAFDQGYLNHVGIPTVNWGPGEYQFAHTDLDMASVARTRDAALAYATLILQELA
ncbi:MAG: YgeY family selenium metabolism-linked hydrolase [Thalassobaculales bacterium]